VQRINAKAMAWMRIEARPMKILADASSPKSCADSKRAKTTKETNRTA
jgi:hypothetical protein